MSRIYADFNATTPPSDLVIEAMHLALRTWGNPSSAHEEGRRSRELVDRARAEVAGLAGAEPKQIVFTSGGSEANGLAIFGRWLSDHQLRVLSTTVEHSSVKDSLRAIAGRGAVWDTVAVARDGTFNLAEFAAKLDAFRPGLVTVQTANNETGVVFPIPEIANLCHARGIVLHTDAVQALGKLPFSAFDGADLVSLSAHKIHGPKGVGALAIRKHLADSPDLVPTHYGGAQEVKRRGGTEAVPAIVGFGTACENFPKIFDSLAVRQRRDRFEATLKNAFEVEVLGEAAPRLPNTSMLRFPGIGGEVLLSALDLGGVAVSAGSACSSGSINPSHVLLAMGLTRDEAKESLRFSWGATTTDAEIDTVADLVVQHVMRIRARPRRNPS